LENSIHPHSESTRLNLDEKYQEIVSNRDTPETLADLNAAGSLRQLVNALEEFRALGIDFISLHEGVLGIFAAGGSALLVLGEPWFGAMVTIAMPPPGSA
jgi:hypothetical protein